MANDEFMKSMLSEISEKEYLKRAYMVEAVVDACEEILTAPESNNTIKRCAIDTAYKCIAKIMKGETK